MMLMVEYDGTKRDLSKIIINHVINILIFIMVKNSIKGDKSKFREFTCYVYGSFFSSNYELTWPCSLCRILFIARAISLKFRYVVAETWLYVAYGLRFLNRCREHGLNFDSKVKLQQNLTLRVVGMGKL